MQVRAFLCRVVRGAKPDDRGGPKDWSVPAAIEFVLRMLGSGGTITAVNAHLIEVVTPIPPDSGRNVDRIEADGFVGLFPESIRMIALAVVYWRWLCDSSWTPQEGLYRGCWRIAGDPRSLEDSHPRVIRWIEEKWNGWPPTGDDGVRVAMMLACGISHIADLEAGLAVPIDRDDPRSQLIAALELFEWDRHGGTRPQYRSLREIIADTTPATAAA